MRVLVVGGGPAGVTIGLLLARAGMEVRVIEREPDFERTFRGEGLMPSGLDALYEMRLGPLLERLPNRVIEGWDMFIDRRSTFSVPEPYKELGKRALRVIPQAQFLAGVVEEARHYDNFRFNFETNFRDFIRDGDRIAGAIVESPDGEEEIAADLVIGCDGRGSLVRARADIHLDLIPQTFDVLWFKLPAPESMREHSRMYLMATNETAAICYTSWDGRLQFALTIPKGLRVPPDGADWAEEMGRAAPDELARHIAGVSDAIEGPMRLKVIIGRCPRWHAPGMLLLGDAAHPMSPVRAQGINLALRDAIVAANELVPIGGAPHEVDAALTRIQLERDAEIKRAQNLQYQDTRFWGTRLAPFFIGLAKTLGPVMGRYGWAKRAWRDQQKDLWFGSREVHLRV